MGSEMNEAYLEQAITLKAAALEKNHLYLRNNKIVSLNTKVICFIWMLCARRARNCLEALSIFIHFCFRGKRAKCGSKYSC